MPEDFELNNELTDEELENDLIKDLTDEEILVLTKIRHIRERIQSYISNAEIIELMRNLIDNSKYFSFTSSRTKKYISEENPIFYIKVNDIREVEKKFKHKFKNFGTKNYEETDTDLDIIAQCVQEDVISKFVTALTDIIFDNERLTKIFNENELYLTDRVKEIFKETEIITLSSVFYNLADLKNNNIRIAFVF